MSKRLRKNVDRWGALLLVAPDSERNAWIAAARVADVDLNTWARRELGKAAGRG